MQLIQTVTVGSGGVGSVLFEDIPNCNALIFMGSVSCSITADTAMTLFFNGDTASTYAYTYFGVDTGSLVYQDNSNETGAMAGRMGDLSTNKFGNFRFVIVDPKGAGAKLTLFNSFSLVSATELGFYGGSGTWDSQDAITSIEFDFGIRNLAENSTISMYTI
jgi:hypothetical protein